ncbi:DUF4406 domain-containing protein [Pseudomonas kuykendallii]|uniref:DUF4406 domain-containing protein n=1 Tax=Pseudomonas kuykendallii TaxID=1007099 RepID=A0A1H3EMN5_9PSED|nr:DUF4406 domain-containing protein [Pseudomonas kuykendallii]MCQ4271026.1 DUF4406 domain-containing protein [Pseudomonas kuykendallii]SDX80053.1 protein of unknown function [Pseudomonas kuykendallii]
MHAPTLKRIYVSGPMTGLPDLNFPAFYAEAARLEAMGYEVVNPASLNPANATWSECMRTDIAALMTCDALVLLPGWADSNGAMVELQLAHRLGMRVLTTAEIPAPEAPAAAGTIAVDADALRTILQALLGSPHLIREQQAFADLPNSAISKLVDQYEAWATEQPRKQA